MSAHSSLSLTVYDSLWRDIVEGLLPPGTRLVERDLASRFDVSRVPVREALQRLNREGLVDLVHNRGALVHEHSAQEVADYFLLREILEGGVARLAALRHTPDQLERLRHCNGRAAVNFATGDHAAGMAATVEFHLALAEAANSDIMRDAAEPMLRRAQWTLHRYHDERALISEHEAIIEAIEAADGPLAEQFVRGHAQHGMANSQTGRSPR